MEEDGQQVQMPPKAGTTPKQKDVAQVMALPPNDNITLILASEFLGTQSAGSSHENPVHLSDATEASVSGSCLMKDVEMEDEAVTLGHFSNTLHKMTTSIMDLEDGYFKALHEVIIEMEKALCDMSHIDAHYVSRVVTVMNSWQEVVQTAMSHMEGIDTTIYLAHWEDAQKAMKEYVAMVIQAHQEHDTAHKEEQKRWKEAIKANDFEHPVVRLLHVTRKVAHTQTEKAVDAFLARIKSTLQKHVPVNAQGPLIANALSMTFQFQMSMWCMIGEKCIYPMWAKHSDWCGLAGIIQAIVETFPKNCALMFPPAPAPPTLFASTFRPAPSDENDDNDNDDTLGAGKGFHRFGSSSPAPSNSEHGSAGGFSHTPAFTSTPLLHGGAFILASDPKEVPSSAPGMPPGDEEDRSSEPIDEELDIGLEGDDEAKGKKELTEAAGDKSMIDLGEVELLKEIIKTPTGGQPSTAPKSGDKWGSIHLDGGSSSSDSSVEDLDTRGQEEGVTPTKALHPSQWSDEDIDIVHQIRYKTDIQCFQTYRRNKIDPDDIASINTKNHSAYIDVAKVDPGSVIWKSVFSVGAYCETIRLRGGDTSKFDKEVGTKFKMSAKGSRAPDSVKVTIDRVMLVCQRENGIDVAYSDPDGFGHPGTMGLWDLHLTDALSRAKMQLPSGRVDVNFCPLCAF